jgi:osmotically-inducible protein OsmY
MTRKRYSLTAVAALLFLAALAVHADDDEIFDKVRQRLNNDPDIKGSHLSIEVKDGVVTLRGAVTAERYKNKAERLTRRVAGVKSVVNRLTVEAPKPPR